MSPRDPSFSAKPITEAGPYTSAQRDAFLAGNSAGTKLAPHHRHQIPVRDGGVIENFQVQVILVEISTRLVRQVDILQNQFLIVSQVEMY